MKNALILTGMWLAIIAVAYTAVYWDRPTEGLLPITALQEVGEPAVYVHPDGSFDVAAPPEWLAIAEEHGVRLSHHEGQRTVWVFSVMEMDLCQAIEEARGLAGLDDLLPANSAAGVDDPCTGTRVRLRYEDEEGGRLLLARARQEGERSVVLLAMGRTDEAQHLERDADGIWERVRAPGTGPVIL